jgi:tetratricopeptide (TPR) repeat protein
MDRLANAYTWIGRHSESIALHQAILENRKAAFGPDHPETHTQMANLAEAYQFAGQLDATRRLLEYLLAKQEVTDGPSDPKTLDTMKRLAWTYGLMDDLPKSLALFEKHLALKRAAIGPGQVWMGDMSHYPEVCQWSGKSDQAEQLIRDFIKHNPKQRDSPDQRNRTTNVSGFLAWILLSQGRYDEAEPFARQAVSGGHIEDLKHYYWESVLGAVLHGQKKYVDAEPLLLQGYEGMRQREAIHPAVKRRMREARQWIVHFYEATNQPDKARAWREKLPSETRPN